MQVRRRLGILAVAAGVLARGGDAWAFHEKGVANCNGCHLTHGDPGKLVGPSADKGLLIAESPTDVCLVCHARGSGQVFGVDPLVPPPETGPGNFVFLTEDNLNDATGGRLNPILGDAAGHNVFAPGHGLRADPRHTLAPGGTFPSAELGCTSCHDPHGNANFRMLHGAGASIGGAAPSAGRPRTRRDRTSAPVRRAPATTPPTAAARATGAATARAVPRPAAGRPSSTRSTGPSARRSSGATTSTWAT